MWAFMVLLSYFEKPFVPRCALKHGLCPGLMPYPGNETTSKKDYGDASNHSEDAKPR